MKSCILCLGFIFIIFITGCDNVAFFDQAQPADKPSLSSIPGRLQGDYLAADSASVITVAANRISRRYDYYDRILKDSLLPKLYALSNDTLIDLQNGIKYKVTVSGDTIITHSDWVDTLFQFSKDFALKKFRGHYFLNQQVADGAWNVLMMTLSHGDLTLNSISSKGDIERLKSITETAGDTISSVFAPTRPQFRKFLKEGGFSGHEVFRRIRVERGR